MDYLILYHMVEALLGCSSEMGKLICCGPELGGWIQSDFRRATKGLRLGTTSRKPELSLLDCTFEWSLTGLDDRELLSRKCMHNTPFRFEIPISTPNYNYCQHSIRVCANSSL